MFESENYYRITYKRRGESSLGYETFTVMALANDKSDLDETIKYTETNIYNEGRTHIIAMGVEVDVVKVEYLPHDNDPVVIWERYEPHIDFTQKELLKMNIGQIFELSHRHYLRALQEQRLLDYLDRVGIKAFIPDINTVNHIHVMSEQEAYAEIAQTRLEGLQFIKNCINKAQLLIEHATLARYYEV